MMGSSDPERIQPNIAMKGLSGAYLAIALSRSTCSTGYQVSI